MAWTRAKQELRLFPGLEITEPAPLSCASCAFASVPLVSKYRRLSQYFASYTNVCLFPLPPSSTPQVLYFVREEAGMAQAAVAANESTISSVTEPHLVVPIELTSLPTNSTYDLVRGTFYTLPSDQGNIAHTFQGLACELAALLAPSHRTEVNVTLDGIVATRLTSYQKLSWSHLHVFAAASAVARSQAPRRLILEAADVFATANNEDSTRPNIHYHCYEHLITPVPNACGGASMSAALYPANAVNVFVGYRHELLTGMALEEERPCMRTALVYGRTDQQRRRLVNVNELSQAIRDAIPGLNVTVLTAMPLDPMEQARLFNAVDLHVSVHSASVYNSIFMPNSSVIFEIGGDTWWGRFLSGQFARVGILRHFQFKGTEDVAGSLVPANPDVRVTAAEIVQIVATAQRQVICLPQTTTTSVVPLFGGEIIPFVSALILVGVVLRATIGRSVRRRLMSLIF